MSVGKDFEAFAVDLFSPLDLIRIERMFGGAMVYQGDLGFAFLDNDAVWIEVDDVAEPNFFARGCARFTYPMKDGRLMQMSYRQMSVDALDDSEEACRWAQFGLEAAVRKIPKAPRSKTKSRP